MEHHTSLTSLMIVVGVAFLVPVLLHRFRIKVIPVVVAEIIAGLIIGQSGLNLVEEDQWLELLSLFGLIFLMFLSGLEIQFDSFKKKSSHLSNKQQVNPFLLAIVIFVAILIVSIFLGFTLLWIGLTDDPYLMTLIIATISLGVVVPVLKEKKIINQPLGQVILLVTVISDLVTMILLAVYIALLSSEPSQMFYLLFFFFFAMVVYLSIRWFKREKLEGLVRDSTAQIGTRAVFALILWMVVLSETFEVEIILGAFLAGVIVSLMGPDKQFVHQLDSFGYGFLIPIFFVMIGVNLDLWMLLSDPTTLILIPVLLVVLYVSKLIPAIILRRWYSWRHIAGAGVLLSSTLSFVIVAAEVAANLGLITEQIQGSLILVAVITCILSPILFNRFYPKEEEQKSVIGIVGANFITLPVSRELSHESYEVHLFTTTPPKDIDEESRFPIIEMENLEIETLEKNEVFRSDILAFCSNNDDINLRLARHAKSLGHERIIVRIENPEKYERTMEEGGITAFSSLYASRTLLKALIEHPSAINLITKHDDSVQEIEVNNDLYHQASLRDLPHLGDTLIMRIFRGDSFLIPHGYTQIQKGDRLLVSGSPEQILEMKQILE